MRELRESMGCDENRFLKWARECGSSEHPHAPVRRQIGREGGWVPCQLDPGGDAATEHG